MRWDIDADKKQKLRCICLQDAKRCKRYCEKDTVEYDQYQSLQQCFRNRDDERFR